MSFGVHRIKSSFANKHYPLSWHLVLLVLAAMIPLVIFSVAMVKVLADYERNASERRLMAATRDLAAILDQEIQSTERTLSAIAQSGSLRHGDLRSFHNELVNILERQPSWLTIVLHSP